MYIYIEDLIVNALIEIIEKSDKDEKEVSFFQINNYSNKVLQYLNDRQEDAIILSSKERIDSFLYTYSDYFELYTEKCLDGIRLKENVDINWLWKEFRGYLSVNVLLAFRNKDAINALEIKI